MSTLFSDMDDVAKHLAQEQKKHKKIKEEAKKQVERERKKQDNPLL